MFWCAVVAAGGEEVDSGPATSPGGPTSPTAARAGLNSALSTTGCREDGWDWCPATTRQRYSGAEMLGMAITSSESIHAKLNPSTFHCVKGCRVIEKYVILGLIWS